MAPEKARVVIIGGGVIGCSVAYHLSKKGWDGIILCEKDELAVWATARAIGHVILYTLDPAISRLNQHSVETYAGLEAETGFSPGFHPCGNLRLATEPARLQEFYRYQGVAAVTGASAELIDAEEIRRIWPLMRTDGVLAGMLNPNDGHASPGDLAQSLAAGARQRGATIRRQCEVTGLNPLQDGGWRVETAKGTILCDHVVSCTGNHARRTARMRGGESQCVPVRHQYIITEPLPELVERRKAGLPELPVVRDPDGSFYFRQEGDALAMGAYDGRGEAKFLEDMPDGESSELFPDALDKLLPYLEQAMSRVPAFETAGIRNVVNYAMPYTPDDLPMTGPAFGLKNFWLAEGNPFGITLAGGVGWQIAEWIVEGDPSIDLGSCDATRFGDWASRKWAARKVEEAYQHTYLIPEPGEELTAGRDIRTTPLHDLLAAKGAQFGPQAGWERAKWFRSGADDTAERAVARECAEAMNGAAVADLSQTPRFRVSGADAVPFLERVLGTPLPAPLSVGPGYSLSPRGGFRAVFTVYREDTDSFLLSTAPMSENRDLDGLLKARTPEERVDIENLTGREGTLLLLGERARRLLADAAGSDLAEDPGVDVGDDDFAAGTGRLLTLGYAPARVVRTDPYGFPGWEIHARYDLLRHVYLALGDARPLGSLALEVLRLHTGTPAAGCELTRDYSPAEAGLTDALDDRPSPYRLIRLALPGGAPVPLGAEPLRDGERRIVGHTTSGAAGVPGETAKAFAYIETTTPLCGLEVRLAGEWRPCNPL